MEAAACSGSFAFALLCSRKRIDGAVERCRVLGESHVRLIVYIFSMVIDRARTNAYDGEEEFWVTVKETGKRTEETSFEEQHLKRAQDRLSSTFVLAPASFVILRSIRTPSSRRC